MTRARAKLLGEYVNSLLIEYNVCDHENFILPKSMYLCMIRVVDNTNIGGASEEQQGLEHDVTYGVREEREACARNDDEGFRKTSLRSAPGRPDLGQAPTGRNRPRARPEAGLA